jgi:Mn2+/Fe2+ NRAMP family transporter
MQKNMLRTTIFARCIAILILSAIIFVIPSLLYSQSQAANSASKYSSGGSGNNNSSSSQIAIFSISFLLSP